MLSCAVLQAPKYRRRTRITLGTLDTLRDLKRAGAALHDGWLTYTREYKQCRRFGEGVRVLHDMVDGIMSHRL